MPESILSYKIMSLYLLMVLMALAKLLIPREAFHVRESGFAEASLTCIFKSSKNTALKSFLLDKTLKSWGNSAAE